MKLNYKIERQTERGGRESSVQEFDLESVRVGRGSSSDIRLDSPLVALTHAVFKLSSGTLSIEDLGSTAGVRVNGAVVKFAQLKAGDEIKLGDVTLQVTQESGVWGIRREITQETKGVDEDELLLHRLRALNISAQIPRMLNSFRSRLKKSAAQRDGSRSRAISDQ